MSWHVAVTGVRRHEMGLRWRLEASTADLTTIVWADTTRGGRLLDLQSDEYVHTTGDDELDYKVEWCITSTIAMRNASQTLDGIDRQQWGRVQRPADRRRWAA